jgi:hypothetical protein
MINLNNIIQDFIKKIVIEIKKEDNKCIIKNDIFNPIFSIFAQKIYPYVSLLFAMYTINLILIIIILILIVKKNI